MGLEHQQKYQQKGMFYLWRLCPLFVVRSTRLLPIFFFGIAVAFVFKTFGLPTAVISRLIGERNCRHFWEEPVYFSGEARLLIARRKHSLSFVRLSFSGCYRSVLPIGTSIIVLW
jgi:hypothetical protein